QKAAKAPNQSLSLSPKRGYPRRGGSKRALDFAHWFHVFGQVGDRPCVGPPTWLGPLRFGPDDRGPIGNGSGRALRRPRRRSLSRAGTQNGGAAPTGARLGLVHRRRSGPE